VTDTKSPTLEERVADLEALLRARDAEIQCLTEESAYWKDLYEAYCKPDDVAAMEIARDAAVQRADEAEEDLRQLRREYGRLNAMFKERSDWAQRVWLAWCSARNRADDRAKVGSGQ
jgi:predicted  nucleic acid-binding Zn-ribbon protein